MVEKMNKLDHSIDLKTTIAVFGRFHAFNLAYHLQERGYLHQLISTYPQFLVEKFDIDPNLVCSLFTLEIASRLWGKLPSQVRDLYNTQFLFLEKFDKAVSRTISGDCNLFVGWAGTCYEAFKVAKSKGAVTVVERGSSHMKHQTAILTEEYDKWGLTFSSTHPEVYRREIETYSSADYISVPSCYAKRTFQTEGIPTEKLIHVPYGASLRSFYPVAKEDSIFRVIHCGGINLRKGVQYLLQAFYELNLPDAELWLVGTPAEEIKPFLEKYHSDRIQMKGQKPQEQLRWYFSQCSVFCLASVEDGFGMVIPQAMACGLPVIHTTNTGGEDVVRDGIDGFCIPIRDIDAIKEKVLFLYENSKRRKEMGISALAQAQNTLSWNDYGSNISMAYQKVAAKNSC